MVPLVPPDGRGSGRRPRPWSAARLLVDSTRGHGCLPVRPSSCLWQQAFTGISAAGLLYAAVAAGVARAGARLAFLRRMLSWVPEEQHAARCRAWKASAPACASSRVGRVGCGARLRGGVLPTGAELGRADPRHRCAALPAGGRTARAGTPGVGSPPARPRAGTPERRFLAAWPGPVLALVGLGVVALGPWVARWRERAEARRRVELPVWARTSMHWRGAVYALASRRRADPALAVPQLISERLHPAWTGAGCCSAAFPVTAATRGRHAIRGRLPVGGCAGLDSPRPWRHRSRASPAVCGLSVVLMARAFDDVPQSFYGALFTESGAALALGAAGSTALAHAAGQWLKERRQDISRGLGRGRDVWLIGCGGLLAVVAVRVQGAGADALPLSLAALGLAVIVALHCAWSEQTGRHVYFVQVAVVGVYAMVRALYITGLRPEHDALFALALGFALVGVTVLARRAGIPPVAGRRGGSRRCCPCCMGGCCPRGHARGGAARGRLGPAVRGARARWSTAGWFGSLAAAACNVALLIGALAFGPGRASRSTWRRSACCC